MTHRPSGNTTYNGIDTNYQSVRITHAPGGNSTFSLGWGENPGAEPVRSIRGNFKNRDASLDVHNRYNDNPNQFSRSNQEYGLFTSNQAPPPPPPQMSNQYSPYATQESSGTPYNMAPSSSGSQFNMPSGNTPVVKSRMGGGNKEVSLGFDLHSGSNPTPSNGVAFGKRVENRGVDNFSDDQNRYIKVHQMPGGTSNMSFGTYDYFKDSDNSQQGNFSNNKPPRNNNQDFSAIKNNYNNMLSGQSFENLTPHISSSNSNSHNILSHNEPSSYQEPYRQKGNSFHGGSSPSMNSGYGSSNNINNQQSNQPAPQIWNNGFKVSQPPGIKQNRFLKVIFFLSLNNTIRRKIPNNLLTIPTNPTLLLYTLINSISF